MLGIRHEAPDQYADHGSAPARIVRGRSSAALYDPESGRLLALSPSLAGMLEVMFETGDHGRAELVMAAAGLREPAPRAPPPSSIPVRSISLAIAGQCNLACVYCYADQGSFGGSSRTMDQATVLAAVDGLIGSASAGELVRISFLGGEPLTSRALLRQATKYAIAKGAAAGVRVAFSVTTNGTLLNPADADFLDDHGFAVTISLDGAAPAHDAVRPSLGGRPSYQRAVAGARRLLDRAGRRCFVAARASITPANLDLTDTLREFGSLGFDSIQFTPVLSAPSGKGEMSAVALEAMLARMIECARLFESEIAAGRVLPFANIVSTLRGIHQRARDEYGCAAGGSYVAVSGGGGIYACHRFIDDERARLGDLVAGVDPDLQAGWLNERNVRNQAPCSTCWARSLCGGGCHFEVLNRGRAACDYLRGWIDHSLGVYLRLTEERPEALAMILGASRAP